MCLSAVLEAFGSPNFMLNLFISQNEVFLLPFFGVAGEPCTSLDNISLTKPEKLLPMLKAYSL